MTEAIREQVKRTNLCGSHYKFLKRAARSLGEPLRATGTRARKQFSPIPLRIALTVDGTARMILGPLFLTLTIPATLGAAASFTPLAAPRTPASRCCQRHGPATVIAVTRESVIRGKDLLLTSFQQATALQTTLPTSQHNHLANRSPTFVEWPGPTRQYCAGKAGTNTNE